MKRQLVVVVMSLMLVLGGTGAVGAEEQMPLPVPDATAALGDSITRAFHSSCGLLNDCPQESWSTGRSVDSHVVRLEAIGGGSIRGDNLAVTGAVAADLAAQAAGIAADVDYVTILIGANDACTDTVGQMTPVTDFRTSIETALNTVNQRAPGAAVFVAGIPDLYRLWEIGKDSGSARFAWWLYGICQSMLASPRSTRQADVDRRLTVRERVVNYNTALAEECSEYAGTCRYDGGAVYGYPFELSHLSTIDYFHPNVAGQQVLASITWDAGYTWSSGEPPPNTPPTADAGPDQTVTADASGNAFVTLDGSGSNDTDGDLLSYSWAWTSGSASGESPSVGFTVGVHDVTLTVDDGRGGSATDAVVITVLEQPPGTTDLHVGDLDGSSVDGRRNRWDATVTITVHDQAERAVAGVLVEGSWSEGAKGGGSCTTDGNGSCQITKSRIKANQSSATFTVSNLTQDGAAYDGVANHDPDGDSSGTSVVVLRP